MDIKQLIKSQYKILFCIGVFICLKLDAQQLKNPVLIDGGDNLLSLTGLSFGSSVYLHAYNFDNNAGHSFLYKINNQGIDSVLLRDFNDSITYGFRQCFEKNGELYWIGTYDFPQSRQFESKGIGIVKTDSNLIITDRILLPKNSNSLITSDFKIDGDSTYISYFDGSNFQIGLIEINTNNNLNLIIDTIYTSIQSFPPPIIKIDNEIKLFHYNSNKYNTISLPSYEVLSLDSIFEFSRPFTGYGVIRVFNNSDSTIFAYNPRLNRFILLDNSLNILDTMSFQNFTSTPYSSYYDFDSEVIYENSLYYGGTNPSPSALNPTWENGIVIAKIKNLQYQWDCLISDDSTSKTLTNMFFSNDSNHIYLQYVEYDHRKGNFEFDVVITMMDTMCNILSTHKIAKQKVDVLVYPNPTSEAFTFKGSANDTYALALYNLSGKVVLNKKQVANDTSINVDHLPAGMYMLHVQSERNPEQVSVIKIVVQ